MFLYFCQIRSSQEGGQFLIEACGRIPVTTAVHHFYNLFSQNQKFKTQFLRTKCAQNIHFLIFEWHVFENVR